MRFWPVPGGRGPLGQVEPITVQVCGCFQVLAPPPSALVLPRCLLACVICWVVGVARAARCHPGGAACQRSVRGRHAGLAAGGLGRSLCSTSKPPRPCPALPCPRPPLQVAFSEFVKQVQKNEVRRPPACLLLCVLTSAWPSTTGGCDAAAVEEQQPAAAAPAHTEELGAGGVAGARAPPHVARVLCLHTLPLCLPSALPSHRRPCRCGGWSSTQPPTPSPLRCATRAPSTRCCPVRFFGCLGFRVPSNPKTQGYLPRCRPPARHTRPARGAGRPPPTPAVACCCARTEPAPSQRPSCDRPSCPPQSRSTASTCPSLRYGPPTTPRRTMRCSSEEVWRVEGGVGAQALAWPGLAWRRRLRGVLLCCLGQLWPLHAGPTALRLRMHCTAPRWPADTTPPGGRPPAPQAQHTV